MNLVKIMVISLMAAVTATTTILAQERYVRTVEDAEYEDVWADLEDAIVNKGLVVEHVGHIAKMLERTADAVGGGSDKLVYQNSNYLQFCSAKLTHKASQQDPRNMSICPFLLYAFETKKEPGKVSIGYRNPDFGSLDPNDAFYKEVHAFLKGIVDGVADDY